MRSSLTFQVAGKSALVIRNREPGNTELFDDGQALGLTEGTQAFVYDMSLSTKTYSFQLSNLTRFDRERFQSWFDSDAKGMAVQWSVTIPGLAPEVGQGTPTTISNCRFLSGSLQWTEGSRDGWWSVSFDFFTQTAGPTGLPT